MESQYIILICFDATVSTNNTKELNQVQNENKIIMKNKKIRKTT
jgi:hypothetical protein